MKLKDRTNKKEYRDWKKRHPVDTWGEVEDAIRDLERHEHPEDNRYLRLVPHICQVYADANQVIAGNTVINFNGEDYLDASTYTHPAANQVTVQRGGRYRLTYKIVSDESIRTRVLVDGVINDRGTSWDGT